MVESLPFPLQFTDDLGHHGILIIRDLEDVVQLVESNSLAPGHCGRWGFRCRGIEGHVGKTLEGVVGEGVALSGVVDPLLEALEVQSVVAPAEALKNGLVFVLGLRACESPSLVVEVLDQVAVLVALRGEAVRW